MILPAVLLSQSVAEGGGGWEPAPLCLCRVLSAARGLEWFQGCESQCHLAVCVVPTDRPLCLGLTGVGVPSCVLGEEKRAGWHRAGDIGSGLCLVSISLCDLELGLAQDEIIHPSLKENVMT